MSEQGAPHPAEIHRGYEHSSDQSLINVILQASGAQGVEESQALGSFVRRALDTQDVSEYPGISEEAAADKIHLGEILDELAIRRLQRRGFTIAPGEQQAGDNGQQTAD